MTRLLRSLVLGAALLVACRDSSGPAEPQPGTLTVQFTTNATTDRAVLIQLSGPGAISNVQPTGAGMLAFASPAGTSVKAIVTGNLVSGTLLQFSVDDVNKVKAYRASIVELADNTNALRTSLAGRSVRISK